MKIVLNLLILLLISVSTVLSRKTSSQKATVLSLQWLPTAARVYNFNKPVVFGFGIHGLWPDIPQCNNSPNKKAFCDYMKSLFNDNKYSSTRDDLVKYWPSVSPGSSLCAEVSNENDLNFWLWWHEYSTHFACYAGTCGPSPTPIQFLKTVVDLSKGYIRALNGLAANQKNGMFPADMVSSIAGLILSGVADRSKYIRLTCMQENGKYYLHEVRINLPEHFCGDNTNSGAFLDVSKNNDIGSCPAHQQVFFHQNNNGSFGWMIFFIVLGFILCLIAAMKYYAPKHFQIFLDVLKNLALVAYHFLNLAYNYIKDLFVRAGYVRV